MYEIHLYIISWFLTEKAVSMLTTSETRNSPFILDLGWHLYLVNDDSAQLDKTCTVNRSYGGHPQSRYTYQWT